MLSIFFTAIYLGCAFLQMWAIFDFFNIYMHWHSFFAMLAAFFIASCPIIGGVCGIVAAINVWHWDWWQALLLFFPSILIVLLTSTSMLSWGCKVIQNLFRQKEIHPDPKDYREVYLEKNINDSVEGALDDSHQIRECDISVFDSNVVFSQEGVTQESKKLPSHQILKEQEDSFFLVKLFRGEYSLAKSFWFFGILIGTAINLLAEVIGTEEILAKMVTALGLSGTLLVLHSIFIASVCYSIVLNIGVWRASCKYSGNQIWAFFGKLFVIIWWFTLFFSVLSAFRN